MQCNFSIAENFLKISFVAIKYSINSDLAPQIINTHFLGELGGSILQKGWFTSNKILDVNSPYQKKSTEICKN